MNIYEFVDLITEFFAGVKYSRLNKRVNELIDMGNQRQTMLGLNPIIITDSHCMVLKERTKGMYYPYNSPTIKY
jgi:hypothetical protein